MALPVPTAFAAGLDSVLDRTVAPGYLRTGLALRRRLPTWPADPPPDALAGRVAAVTGATSGLGLATAEGLLRLGAEVRLVVRDVAKGERVAHDLRTRFPGARLHVDRCDLGDLDDVRRCAADLDADLGEGPSTCSSTTPARCRPSGPSPRRATSWRWPCTCSARC